MLLALPGRRLAYDLTGPIDAPVVVLCHCLSADMGVWSEQVPALHKAGFRALRLDMAGHGGSTPAPGPVTMPTLAADVIAVMDHLGVTRAHFLGVSIGGMIGQQLGLDHPARFASLMLCGTAPDAVPGPPQMWPQRFAAIAEAGSLEPIADAAMRRWFTDTFVDTGEPRMAQIRATVAATSPQGYRAGAEAIIAFDVIARLPDITLPTLVLCGDEDTGTPPEGNRLIAARVPGAGYVEMENARHVPMIEYPEAFNAIMLGWLASQG